MSIRSGCVHRLAILFWFKLSDWLNVRFFSFLRPPFKAQYIVNWLFQAGCPPLFVFFVTKFISEFARRSILSVGVLCKRTIQLSKSFLFSLWLFPLRLHVAV